MLVICKIAHEPNIVALPLWCCVHFFWRSYKVTKGTSTRYLTIAPTKATRQNNISWGHLCFLFPACINHVWVFNGRYKITAIKINSKIYGWKLNDFKCYFLCSIALKKVFYNSDRDFLNSKQYFWRKNLSSSRKEISANMLLHTTYSHAINLNLI